MILLASFSHSELMQRKEIIEQSSSSRDGNENEMDLDVSNKPFRNLVGTFCGTTTFYTSQVTDNTLMPPGTVIDLTFAQIPLTKKQFSMNILISINTFKTGILFTLKSSKILTCNYNMVTSEIIFKIDDTDLVTHTPTTPIPINTWFQISIAYFNNDGDIPSMMNIQVELKNVLITLPAPNDFIATATDIQLTINKDIDYAFTHIWFWKEYINGPWGLINSVSKVDSNIIKIVNCDPIKDTDLDSGVHPNFSQLTFTSTTVPILSLNDCTAGEMMEMNGNCESFDSSCIDGYYTDSKLCSCSINNKKELYFAKLSGGDISCQLAENDELNLYSFEENPITIPITSPETAKSYTIDFWIYLDKYVSSSTVMTPLTITWSERLKIFIDYQDSKFIFKCYPGYAGGNYNNNDGPEITDTTFIPGDPLKLEFQGKWDRIRCSTNLLTKKFLYGSNQYFYSDNFASSFVLSTATRNELSIDKGSNSKSWILFIKNISLSTTFFESNRIPSTPNHLFSFSMETTARAMTTYSILYNGANIRSLNKDPNWVGFNILDEISPISLALITIPPCVPGSTKNFFISPAQEPLGTNVELPLKTIANQDSTNNIQTFTVNLYINLLEPSTTSPSTSFILFCYDKVKSFCIQLDTSNPPEKKIQLIHNAAPLITVLGEDIITALFDANKWFPISMSYYYSESDKVYYPSMFNFQINGKDILISMSDINTAFPTGMFRDGLQIIIMESYRAYYGGIWVWTKYIKGVLGRTFTTTDIKERLFTVRDCTCVVPADLDTVTTSSIICAESTPTSFFPVEDQCSGPGIFDFDFVSSSWKCSQNLDTCYDGHYREIEKSLSTTDQDCTCDASYSHYLLKRDSTKKSLCFTSEYYDLSPYLPLTLTVEKRTSNSYSIEFWVLLVPYVKESTYSYEITWENSMKIELKKSGVDQFKSICYPVFKGSTYPIASGELTIQTQTWFYVRCSTSLEPDDQSYFHYLYWSGKSSDNGSALDNSYSRTTTLLDLTISVPTLVDQNKGVIFLRQLKLWNIFIQTDSHTIDAPGGNYLTALNIYNTIYPTIPFSLPLTFEIKDYMRSSTNTLAIKGKWLGYNYVEMDYYHSFVPPADSQYSFLLGPIAQKTTGEYIDFPLKEIAYDQDKGFTINFFIRLLSRPTTGATREKQILGITDELALSFDKTYILGSPSTVIATATNAENNFNTWVPISIAYYNNQPIKTEFPPMANFQIGTNNIIIDRNNLKTIIDAVFIIKLIIKEDAFAFFAKIWVWKTYLNGGWAFYHEHIQPPALFEPVKLLDIGEKRSCVRAGDTDQTLGDYIINCVYSKNIILDESTTCYPDLTSITGSCISPSPTQPSESKCNSGRLYDKDAKSSDLCACALKTEQMIMYHSYLKPAESKEYTCVEPKDFEFSRFSPITLADGSLNSIFTLEFWAYYETYDPTTFKVNVFTIDWPNHAKIEITDPNIVFTVDDGSTVVTKGFSLTEPKWFYVRASVDHNKKQSLLVTSLTEVSISTSITGIQVTTGTGFTITITNVNAGIVFFKYVKLWKIFDPPNIEEVIPDGNLLHYIQDPKHKEDLTDKGTKITGVTENTNWVGYNILPDIYPPFKIECKPDENNYFIAPATNLVGVPTEIKFKPIYESEVAKSINLYMLLLTPTTSVKYELFCYGPTICIKYENNGLKPLTLENGGDVISQVDNFDQNINKWVQISLGYYYATKESTFPPMLNFQVNMIHIAVDNTKIAELQISKMRIPSTSLAIFGKVWIWKTYLTGGYNFVSNNPLSDTGIFIPVKLIDNTLCPCIQAGEIEGTYANYDIKCRPIYAPISDKKSFCSTNTLLDNAGVCHLEALNCPYGFHELTNLPPVPPVTNKDQVFCSCDYKNHKDMILLKTPHNKSKCSIQLIEFNRVSATKVPKIPTKDQFTMEFWFYFQSYKTDTFTYTVDLEDFMKITIEYPKTKKNIATCYPVYVEDADNYCQPPPAIPGDPCPPASKYTPTSSTIDLEEGWNHIRCSVDRQKDIKSYFHYQHSKNDRVAKNINYLELNTISTLKPMTTLQFETSEVNAGVVYIQHFRLWHCYLCHLRFVNNIIDPGIHAKLIINYDTKYSDKLKSLVGTFETLLTDDSKWLGYNQLDESKYKKLILPQDVVYPGAFPPTEIPYYYLYAPTHAKNKITNEIEEVDTVFKHIQDIQTPTMVNPLSPDIQEISIVFFVKLLGWTGLLTDGVTDYPNYFIMFSYGNVDIRYYPMGTLNNIHLFKGATQLTNAYSNPIIGRWVEISISYYYEKSRKDYFPAMLNFQIDYNAIPLINYQSIDLQDLDLYNLKIPKTAVGYYGRFYVWQKYMTGSWNYMINKGKFIHYFWISFIDQQGNPVYPPPPPTPPSAVADPVCILPGNMLEDTVKYNPFEYKCVFDYSVILDNDKYCDETTISSFYKKCSDKNPVCEHGFYTNIPGDICACDITNFDVYVKLYSKDHQVPICIKPVHRNFFKSSPVEISNVLFNNNRYTMEFWMYLETYLSTVKGFTGFTIDWAGQIKFQLSLDSKDNYSITCYPNNPSMTISNKLPLSAKAWVYVQCGADRLLKKYSLFNTVGTIPPTNQKEKDLTGTFTPITTSSLSFKAANSNEGVLYFRQIRLWSNYFPPNNSLFKREFTTQDSIKKFYYLLHVWDPYYNTDIKDIAGNAADGTFTVPQTPPITGPIPPANPQQFFAYNILSWEYKEKTDMIKETDEVYHDLLNLNRNILTIKQINPARNDRYTIEFYTLVDTISKVLTGYSVIWSNLIAVTMIKENDDLKVICWPQAFRINLNDHMNIDSINAKMKYLTNALSINVPSPNKKWIHVRCAMHKNNQEYYLTVNDKTIIKPLRGDLSWNDKTTIQYTDYGMRYFWKEHDTSTLEFMNKNVGNQDLIVFKSIYLFDDYIPMGYKFKNMDIVRLFDTPENGLSEFSSMVLGINFSYYWRLMRQLIYQKNGKRQVDDLYLEQGVYSTAQNLCNPSVPEFSEKISGVDQCIISTSPGTCPQEPLPLPPLPLVPSDNWNYCANVDDPFICKDKFIWDQQQYDNDILAGPNPKPKPCQTTCIKGYIRSPNTDFNKDTICNFKCSNSVYSACTGLTATEIIDLQKSLTCPTPNYFKYNNWCYSETQSEKQFMYFSGCTNFNNINYDVFKTDTFQTKSYLIDFWLKMDRFNEFCPYTEKKYYFIAEPHVIYEDKARPNIIQYEFLGSTPPIKADLGDITFYHWNYIIIHVFPGSNKVSIYVNHKITTPAFSGIVIPTTIELQQLVFCSTTGIHPCKSNTFKAGDIWGAAFYKNIHFWEGTNVSPVVLNQIAEKSFTINLSALCFAFTFSLSTSRDNIIKNIRATDGLNYLTAYDPLIKAYYNDMEMFVNFASQYRFDYSVDHFQDYIEDQEMTSGIITKNKCHLTCATCSRSADPNSCMSCIGGYTLFVSTCMKSTGFFLQTPLTKLNPTDYIPLKIDNYYNGFYLKERNKFTMTIWVKLFGESRDPGDPIDRSNCFIIMKFDSLDYTDTTNTNKRRYICYKADDTTLYFHIDGSDLYKSPYSEQLGEWTLISISSVINESRYDPVLNQYYDIILRFFIQEKEIMIEAGKAPPINGLLFTTIQISNKSVAYFYDYRLYANFIMNPFGYVTGPKSLKHIGLRIPLMNDRNQGCLKISDIYYAQTTTNTLEKELGITCVEDFILYAQVACENNEKFDGKSLDYCSICYSDCHETCSYNADILLENINQGCTCDMSSRNQWLKADADHLGRIYCEKVPNVEYSKGTYRIENVKISRTQQYAIEFFIYVYNYKGATPIGFEGHEVYWDKHNYLHFYNKADKLNVHCSPIFTSENKDPYLTIGDDKELKYFKWQHIICASSLDTMNYLFNDKVDKRFPTLDPSLLFDNREDTKEYTQLIFKPEDDTRTSYGFIFIREIKLWASYSAIKMDTMCKVEAKFFSYYAELTSFLLHYFSNGEGGETMTDLVNVNVRSYFSPATNFVGYNIVDDYTQFPQLNECVVLEIYPITGLMDITKFILRARNKDYMNSSVFKLYFHRKGEPSSYEEIPLDDTTQLEIIRIFNETDLPLLPDEKEITLEFYCDIEYTDNVNNLSAKLVLHREITLTKTLNMTETPLEDLLFDYEINKDMTELEIEDTAHMIKGLFPESDMIEVHCNETLENNCNNNGICYSIGSTDICQCKEGYDGYLCQLDTKNKLHLIDFSSKLLSTMKEILYDDPLRHVWPNNFAKAMDIIADIWIYSTSHEDPVILDNYLLIYDYFVDNQALNLINDDNLNFTLSSLSKIMIYTRNKIKDTKLDMILTKAEWYVPKVNYKSKSTARGSRPRLLQSSNISPSSMTYGYNFTDYYSVDYDLDAASKKYYEMVFNKYQIYLEAISHSEASNNPTAAFSNSYGSFDYYIKTFTPAEFRFKEYFKTRIAQHRSYINPEACLKEYTDQHSLTNTPIYLIYVAFTYPTRIYQADVHNTTISHAHMTRFLDNNLNQFNLTCSNHSIEHFLPVNTPFNPQFGVNYYPYPEKYITEMETDYDNLTYYHKFIFKNGSIDFVNTHKQLRKYYRNFLPRLKYYRMTDGSLQHSPSQLESIVSDYSYFVSNELNSAVHSVITYDQPAQYNRESYYFVYYPQLFKGGVNYLLNIIFYVLATLFIIMVCSALIIIAYSFWLYKKNLSNEVYHEIETLGRENRIFKYARFAWVAKDVPIQLTYAESRIFKQKLKNEPDNVELHKHWALMHKDFFGEPKTMTKPNSNQKNPNEECEELNENQTHHQYNAKSQRPPSSRLNRYADVKKHSITEADPFDTINAGETIVAGAKGIKVNLHDLKQQAEEASIEIEKVSKIMLGRDDSFDIGGINKRLKKNPIAQFKEDQDHLEKEMEHEEKEIEEIDTIIRENLIVVEDQRLKLEPIIEPPVAIVEEVQSISSGSDYDYDEQEFNGKITYYNPIHFMLNYNIYSAFFKYKTPFASRIKQILKPYTHFLLLLSSVSALFIFNYDFAEVKHPDYVSVSKMTAFIAIAIYFANIVSFIISLGSYITVKQKREVMSSNSFDKLIIRDLVTSISLAVFDLFLFGSLFYVCAGFSIIWIEWSGMLLVMWLFTLISDFIVFEIIFELIIFLLYAFKQKYRWIRNMMVAFMWVKNVRNL